MKAIIGGKLYDTETSEELLTYSKGLMNYKLYKTKNGCYFSILPHKGAVYPHDEEYAKLIIAAADPDKYMDMFDDWEEA